MAPTYTRRTRAAKLEPFTLQNAWGSEQNAATIDIQDAAWGVSEVTVNADVTLTVANALPEQARSIALILTGAGGFVVTAPAVDKPYLVVNNCTNAVTVKPAGGTGATIRAGAASWYYTNAAGSIGYVVDTTLDKIKAPTAAVDMGGQKLTGMAPGTAAADAVTMGQIEPFATESTASALLAQKWASNPEDTVVTAGLYSSLHYAAKAAASASTAQTWDPSGYYTKTATDALFAALGSTTRVPRTANTQIALSNKGNFIDITSGTFTQTFAAVASLANGWFCYLRNAGTGDITLDPNGAEQIDGLASYVMYPGETRLVLCDGLALRTVVLNAFNRIFDASGTFIRPPGYSHFGFRLHGGGGGGGKQGDSVSAWGGAAGEVFTMHHAPTSVFGASVSVGVGSGGAGAAVEGSGAVGGSTSLGAFSAAGGIGGVRGVAAWPSYTYGVSKDSDGYVSTAGGSLWSAQFIDPVAAGPAAFTGGIASFPATGSNGTGVGAGGGATHTGPKGGDGFRGQARIWGEI